MKMRLAALAGLVAGLVMGCGGPEFEEEAVQQEVAAAEQALITPYCAAMNGADCDSDPMTCKWGDGRLGTCTCTYFGWSCK